MSAAAARTKRPTARPPTATIIAAIAVLAALAALASYAMFSGPTPIPASALPSGAQTQTAPAAPAGGELEGGGEHGD